MTETVFDPIQFYSTYPSKVIGRPGYPARAAFKSTLLFRLFGPLIFAEIGKITTYVDIGGCFGFGANSMGYHICKHQGMLPKMMVYEIAEEFVKIGRLLFPHIEFVQADFRQWNGNEQVFDLITLFDVVEHLVEPASFLKHVATRSRYVMLKTPMETSGEWNLWRRQANVKNNHPDGHINLFTLREYEKLLKASNLDIVAHRVMQSIFPSGDRMALLPEKDKDRCMMKIARIAVECIPGLHGLARKLFGDCHHVCLCRSRLTK